MNLQRLLAKLVFKEGMKILQATPEPKKHALKTAKLFIPGKKTVVLAINCIISLLLFAVLSIIIAYLSNHQSSQQMAGRWSEDKGFSQVSCFFSANTDVDPNAIEAFRHGLDHGLQEAAIIHESTNPGARLWTDAYSAHGRIILRNDRATLEADAIGIGGDFFLFHPQQLLYGHLFSGNAVMKDYCVIDEEGAWQLFGASNVAGMTVYIGNVPHIISGVIRREKGGLYDDAGLDSTLVYVSYETLDTLGRSNGINHYEIVMPNPVKGYAFGYMTENIGVDEREIEIIENTTRYRLLERIKIVRAFGGRSMNRKAIIYPYWENVARGYEDILALLTLLTFIFLLFPIVVFVVYIVILWRNKSWTMKTVYLYLKDKGERKMEVIRENRKKGKDGFHEGDDFEESDSKKIFFRRKAKKEEQDDMDE